MACGGAHEVFRAITFDHSLSNGHDFALNAGFIRFGIMPIDNDLLLFYSLQH